MKFLDAMKSQRYIYRKIRGWTNIRCFWDILLACNQDGVPVSNLANSGSHVSLCAARARSLAHSLARQLKRCIRAEFDIAVLLLRDVAINTRPFRRRILSLCSCVLIRRRRYARRRSIHSALGENNK